MIWKFVVISWGFTLITLMAQMSDKINIRNILCSFAKLQIYSGRLIGIGGSTSVVINLSAGL